MTQQSESFEPSFMAAQQDMRCLLSKLPQGIQNWSYDKSVHFKKTVKKCEPILKLRPSAKHVDFLKVENHLTLLRKFYQ